MTLSATIGGNAVTVLNQAYNLEDVLEGRSVLKCTVYDSTGLSSFSRGQPIQFTDSVTGTLFTGFVQSSKPGKLGPGSSGIAYDIVCMDNQYRLGKRTNSKNYFNQYGGDIITDFIDTTLADEGIVAAYASKRDTTTADFNRGLLTSTVGRTDTDDGDLELTPAGSDVTILEDTTADFSTGTLTNVAAASNQLTPTTQSAIKLSSQLPLNVGDDYMYITIWSGSMTVGTLDTLHYDIWISSDAPAQNAGVDLIFSDGTALRKVSVAADANGLAPSPKSDLAGLATDQWYSRVVSFPSSLNGKTVNSVQVALEGDATGAYTAYFKNIYLGSQSGNKYFAPTDTVMDVNPPTISQSAGYQAGSTSATIVQVFDPASNSRVSSSYSIDAVKLLKTSTISWIGITPGGTDIALYASYDGGSSYVQCTNNSPLPAFPSGTNTTGLSVKLKEVFITTGTDPTILPTLLSVTVSLLSAPNATKSDIFTSFITQSNWNAGTHSNTTALSNGDLTLPSISRNWNDNTISNQTFFNTSGVTESASSGKYKITLPSGASANHTTYGHSRLDLVGPLTDFTLDVDVTMNADSQFIEAGITWRNIAFIDNSDGPAVDAPAYMVIIIPNDGTGSVEFRYGTNSNVPPDTYSSTTLGHFGTTINTSTTYHLKIVVSGSYHRIYFNNASTPTFAVFDSTYSAPGYIGLYCNNYDNPSNTHSVSFDNLVVTPISTGFWTSPSTSISSLTTSGGSAIYWTEANTKNQQTSAVKIQTSVDGGSSYQDCTNGGAIPNIPAGTSLSGKSVLVKATLTATSQPLSPILRQLAWRVLGAYPGSSGTRSTAPLGNDTMVRSNVVGGFGTSFDSQTYTKTGTGTTNLTSNEALIANTTGDVHMQLGTRTATDEEGTVKFQLSATFPLQGGMELRYTDVDNYYRLSASTTTLFIIKRSQSQTFVLASASKALSTGVMYHMRFRVVGSAPVVLLGKVWADGLSEPDAFDITATD
jgi:hypothetical protein